MNVLTISEIVAMTGGKLLAGDPATLVRGVGTDSRTIAPGSLFIALRGDNFNGHHFLAVAERRGATALLVDDYPVPTCDGAVILVTDTLAALQNLARNYRRRLTCKIIAITGSNGKTSTKDLTATVAGSVFHVSKTQGNLNNHIGLPLSILAIEDRHQVAILEIGMNHPGEIAPLAKITQPDIAIITNIGVAHIEHLGSREAIAEEKSALAAAVATGGKVILHASDEFVSLVRSRTEAEVITAGIDAGDLRAFGVSSSSKGSSFGLAFADDETTAFLPLAGTHMIINATLAVAAGLVLGIPLQTCAVALGQAELTAGRMQIKHLAGLHFLDDSYNANPDSMVAALVALREFSEIGQKIAVLGAMGELGAYAETGYRSVARAAAGIDLLITVGEQAMSMADEAELCGVRVFRANDASAAVSLLQAWADENAWILIKGSRSARMERVVQAFEEQTCSC